MLRKRIGMWIGVLLLLVMALQPAAQAASSKQAPPAPTTGSTGDVSILGSSGAQGLPGDIYYGAIPPNVDYTKPVLLFVHGYNSSAHTWWQETAYHGVNDMYTYAYNNGYRTAFVNVHPDQDMWDNGQLLVSLIDRVRSYYGVAKVTIIAHSKGGVDSNAASVHYGATPKISKIITLGSPHRGTPLADMAFSSWTWWLAAIFGAANEATYVLQTGYMDYYRSITPTDTIPYYTFSGYKCGPINTAMWYGCMAISGEDDGVVPVWSTRIPGGIHLKEGYWDHDEIKMGSRTWSYFFPYIKTASTGQAVALEGALMAAAGGAASDVTPAGSNRTPAAPGNVILRGGATDQAAPAGFPVEPGVSSVTFTVISSSPSLTTTLTGPDGSAVSVAATEKMPAGQVYAGAYMGTATVSAPAAGVWNLSAAASEKAGYLLITSLESDLSAQLEISQKVAAPGGRQTLSASVSGRTPAASQVVADLSRAGQQPYARAAFARSNGRHTATFDLPAGSDIHNVTATVTGTLDGGWAFERTLVSSFAAVAPGDAAGLKNR